MFIGILINVLTNGISSGRGEGPSYMKVPYTYPPFQVISSHDCNDFGIEEYLESEGRCKKAFICVCTSVCMCVLSRSSKTLNGAPKDEGLDEKFSFLVFQDFRAGTKFVHKMKSVYCG